MSSADKFDPPSRGPTSFPKSLQLISRSMEGSWPEDPDEGSGSMLECVMCCPFQPLALLQFSWSSGIVVCEAQQVSNHSVEVRLCL